MRVLKPYLWSILDNKDRLVVGKRTSQGPSEGRLSGTDLADDKNGLAYADYTPQIFQNDARGHSHFYKIFNRH
jgi:hypothetical protein